MADDDTDKHRKYDVIQINKLQRAVMVMSKMITKTITDKNNIYNEKGKGKSQIT